MSGNKLTRLLAGMAASLVMAASALVLTPSSAHADQGIFESSFGFASVSASYWHPTLRHSATACAMWMCQQRYANPGTTATATAAGLWGRKAYWNTY